MGQAPVKKEPKKTEVDEAITSEATLAEEAAALRADYWEDDKPQAMTADLFTLLWPLLRRPIPKGFLLEVGAGDGKPYPSTGVRSVQVQMNRMDNVLGPLWWDYATTYESDGKLCHVEVLVLGADGERLVRRDAWGGVNRGSTEGNLRKGSFTNAAKMAFARIGPGAEVYIGTTDHDPDVDPDAAAEQAKPAARVGAEGANGTNNYEAELEMFLAEKHGRQKKRREADDAMRAIGVGARQRLAELRSHDGSAQALQEIITRARAAADAMAASGEQIGLDT